MSPATSAPLPRYRFVALSVVWCAYLVVFLSRLCVGPLSPFLKQAFDLNNAQIGGLTSATAIAYAHPHSSWRGGWWIASACAWPSSSAR